MPARWLGHAQNFTALVRRYGTNWFFPEILSGLLPTVQVDKHWTADRLNVFGMRMEVVTDGANFPAMFLQAGDVDVLVYRVDWWMDDVNFGNSEGWGAHLFTPLPNYQPADPGAGPVFSYFPWLLGGRVWGSLGTLPDMVGFAGHNAALPQVNIAGIGLITTIGPQSRAAHVITAIVAGGGGPTAVPHGELTAWSFQDPPFRLMPYTRLCVQATEVITANRRMIANFYFSVRPPQGGVG